MGQTGCQPGGITGDKLEGPFRLLIMVSLRGGAAGWSPRWGMEWPSLQQRGGAGCLAGGPSRWNPVGDRQLLDPSSKESQARRASGLPQGERCQGKAPRSAGWGWVRTRVALTLSPKLGRGLLGVRHSGRWDFQASGRDGEGLLALGRAGTSLGPARSLQSPAAARRGWSSGWGRASGGRRTGPRRRARAPALRAARPSAAPRRPRRARRPRRPPRRPTRGP